MFSENSIVSCHGGWSQLYYVVKNKNVNTRGKDRMGETMKEREREKTREWQGEVVKQYNIRQALEHNNTERDKY